MTQRQKLQKALQQMPMHDLIRLQEDTMAGRITRDQIPQSDKSRKAREALNAPINKEK